MAGKTATPARSTKTPSGSTGKQQSILGFFSKAAGLASSASKPSPGSATSVQNKNMSQCLKETTKSNSMSTIKRNNINITPVPSSDAMEPSSSQENMESATVKVLRDQLPSPVTPAEIVTQQAGKGPSQPGSSPSRKVSSVILPTSPFFYFTSLLTRNI